MIDASSGLLSPRLAFALGPGLDVKYRASAKPQTLAIALKATGMVFGFPPIIFLRGWVERANAGLAGGADFSPAASTARAISGFDSSSPEDTAGPSYKWKIEVASVSPLYVRSLVDGLSTPSATVDVEKLVIAGSLALDESALRSSSLSPARRARPS